ncbi:ferredoxin Fer [Halorarius litoreus]|uniref:ferredoxin Fer n=1 Tax=Halorarius litoreus TaxID=2962676 RepID=UPI0020CE729F|nr:ferredoxin Fer [Halorarius litoreus]
MASPFDVLGLDPDADDRAVIEAYRDRVKEAHPDHGGSAAEFQRVKAAYEAVRNGEVDDDAGTAPETDPQPEPREPEGTRVEYVNYDALDDHGWSLDDPELFETAAEAELDPVDYGRLLVEPRESLLEGAENRGFTWPYACRGGACANCAVAVVEGELDQPPNHVLSQEMLDRGIRLSCVGMPMTDELKVVYNVKHLPDLDELLLPAKRFGQVSPSE